MLISQVWRDDFLVIGSNGYDHKKRFTNMTVDENPPKRKRLKSVKSNSDEGRNISDEDDEDYEYEHRQKPGSTLFNNTSECDEGYQLSV